MLVPALGIVGTVAFTVAGQLLLKSQATRLVLPEQLADAPRFIGGLLANPWLWLVVLSAFAAMACWAVVLTRLPLSYAYPFTSLSFVAVLLLGPLCFGESLTLGKLAGTALIVAGVVVGSWSRG